MDPAQMVARPHTQIVQAPPKVLFPSSMNFPRTADPSELQYYYERPMMLNAWTQTTTEDFGYLLDDSLARREQQSKNEKDLLEKIRTLEENLHAHSEILARLHGTNSGSTTSAYAASSKSVQQQLQQMPAQQSALLQHQQLHPQQLIQQPQQQSHPLKQEHKSATVHPTSVINPVQQIPPPTDSVKYTIIADGNGGANDEPIEIQLSEDDGGLNLNSSADSGRLEICLTEEPEIKEEFQKIVTTKSNSSTSLCMQPTSTTDSSTPTPFSKRRKIVPDTQNSNYYFNEHGVLTPIYTTSSPPTTSTNALVNPTDAHAAYKTPTLHKNAKNLLKPPRYETPPPQNNSLGQKMDLDNVMVSIGPNNTRIPAKVYENMSWASPSIATRKLLMSIFERHTLATHSMTGKPSPAFKDHGKPLKQMLDPLVIQDIIFAVTRKCHVSEKEVRNAITTKCADENKMMKLQMNKSRPLRDYNKENMG